MARLRMGELFAGYGGLGMGVGAALAADLEWVAEVEAAPSRVLERHWPGVPNMGDVREVDWGRVPRVDVLVGGFPCQDVSVAGRRRGMRDGTRSGLWSEFVRAIDGIRPEMVVIENVRGLLSAAADGPGGVECCSWCVGDGRGEPPVRALGAVLGDLADRGFDAEWGVFRASDSGAPHRRERLFVLAWQRLRRGSVDHSCGDPGCAACDSVHGSHDAAPAAGAGRGRQLPGLLPSRGEGVERGAGAAADAVRVDPERRGGAGGMGGAREAAGSAGGGAAGGRGEAPAGRQLMPTPEAALAARGGAMDPARRRAAGSSVSLADAVHVLPTVTASEHTGPGHAGEGAPNLRTVAAEPGAFGRYQEAIDWWADVLGRSAPSPTELGPRGGRRLSAAFAEWMMGLPEGHVTGTPGVSRVQQLRMLGNGVVPQQAEAAVRKLMERAVG